MLRASGQTLLVTDNRAGNHPSQVVTAVPAQGSCGHRRGAVIRSHGGCPRHRAVHEAVDPEADELVHDSPVAAVPGGARDLFFGPPAQAALSHQCGYEPTLRIGNHMLSLMSDRNGKR